MERDDDILIKLSDVSAGYEGVTILSDVNITVRSSSFIALVGPNGGGKTTLVRLMLGQIDAMSGELFRRKNLRIGYLPQINDIDMEFPITVEDVIFSGVPCLFRHTEEERRRADELIRFAGLEELRSRQIGRLSGGQRQRAFLCRALMNNPQLLMLDEPSTYMDRDASTGLYALLDKLKNEMAIVLVSHDIDSTSHRARTIYRVERNVRLVANHYIIK